MKNTRFFESFIPCLHLCVFFWSLTVQITKKNRKVFSFVERTACRYEACLFFLYFEKTKTGLTSSDVPRVL